MFSNRLQRIISKDSYTKEWRMNTALNLCALGANEATIISAITGNLNSKKKCYDRCSKENLPFEQVWKCIK